jgi:hypothetical protein
MLQPVSTDGYVPLGRERLERADMIKMPVGENDRGWTGALSKSCLRGGTYRGRRSCDAGIDQYPSTVSGIRRSEEDDVDDCDLAVSDMGRYLPRFVVADLVRFRMLGACALGNWNLTHCFFSTAGCTGHNRKSAWVAPPTFAPVTRSKKMARITPQPIIGTTGFCPG